MKKLKRLICGASVLAMTATGAYAADLAPEPMLGPDWSGFYAGIGLGGFGSRNKLVYDPVNLGSVKPFGFSGGGFLGYNFGYENFVFGIEGDIYANTGKKDRFGTISDAAGNAVAVRARLKDKMSYSIRGRLGYAAGNFMPYITGGWQGMQQRVSFGPPGNTSGKSKSMSGYTIGGGVEWLASGWLADDVLPGAPTFRVEYRYSDYGRNTWNLGPYSLRTKNKSNQFIFGAAWKF
ncbi:MAG: outer membrane protein, partial [Hyphomicrobiales bacterium]